MKPHLDASVVICVYNRPKQIRTCVASLLGMSATGYEIVFVDDASTDETPQILEELATEIRSRGIDVQTVRNEVNRGVSGARNAGIDAATRSVIAFTDSDCTVEHDWLAQLVTPLTDDRISASAGLVVDDPPTNLAELAFFGSSQIGQNALQGRNLIGGNMAIRTKVLRDFRFDDELTYGCDEDDLAHRLSEGGYKFESVPNAVVYHHHPLAMSDYWKRAWKQGQGSAHYWRKTGAWFGRDIVFLLLAIIAAFFVASLGWYAIFSAAVLLLLHLVALCFNQVVFRGKTVLTCCALLPLDLGFTFVKLLSVCGNHLTHSVRRIHGGSRG